MTPYAHMLMNHLKEFKPKTYKELKAAGELEKYCKSVGDEAQKQKDRLVAGGMRDYEAEEVVISELLTL